VQTIIPVSGGGAMRLTTARYYTPSGRSIQALGIEPDIAVQQAKLEKIAGGPGVHEADLKGALINETVKSEKENKDGKDKATPTSIPDDNSADTDEDGLPPMDQEKAKAEGKDGKNLKKQEPPFDYQLARALDLIRGIHLFEVKEAPATAKK
jgi:carboxyl-terminal processing protease